ncbi:MULTISPECIES: hypothetical protein [Staphylococcus]|nr:MULTISPECIES: hypothetical protein [Staphylococcus]MCA2501767.1 hypothetical protein [Staphylococcus xylosus]MCE7780610.1 hypothetical protein [Staphylococcus xylosus]MEB5784505.1 hypothetical protein [Staphylococcus pseudoxylosus]
MLVITCIVLILIVIFLLLSYIGMQSRNKELELDNFILKTQIEKMLKEK